MSQFRVIKRRTQAELTLSTGQSLRGCFFVAGSSTSNGGQERIVDLLNAAEGFFPFESADSADTVLVNRAHLISARLVDASHEVQLDSGYDVAKVQRVVIRLSNRVVLRGTVRLYCAEGRDRLSDYARTSQLFRYVENEDGTFVVNSNHIVELSETSA
jgi:hypothetical protein